jgi:hypothetical protein
MGVTVMKKELMIRVLQELGELLCQTQGHRVGHDEMLVRCKEVKEVMS